RKEYENLLLKLRLGNPEYLSLRRVAPPDLKKLQQLLDRKTTLLSYFVTPEKTLAFIITQDAFRAVELAVGENQLKTAISKARKPGRPNEPPPDALAALYAWLIAPLKSHLTTPSIGLIPHNALHYLPFAGLTDGQHYLGEEYILFSLPSASLLEFAQKKHKSDNGRILAMAYSEAKNSPLYYANREVEALAKLRETHMLSGKDATEAAFKRLSPDFSIIHLAAHGKLEAANPLFSRIFLAADEENDGALEVHEVYDLDLPQTDLVVLSACESDLGKRSRGDDIIGLTRAFMYAGTSSVIASLWKVNDRATQELMTVFYKQLKRGKSKAEALQVAQAKIRKKYRHPYYWAGFVLSGDPGASKQQSPWLAIVVIGTIIGGILVVILRNYYGKDAPPA
ncbi:MAG: CHAT domain-containing protein, partial [bacterium]|nr:CHAT domain-containing protein [bacterium]